MSDKMIKSALKASPALRALARRMGYGSSDKAFRAVKKPIPLKADFAEAPGVTKTLEGDVQHQLGDAIMTGVKGERWPIPRVKFDKTYEAVEGMPGYYTKRNLPGTVRQIHGEFEVPVSWQDAPLRGKPGDFRVKYGPNDYGVVDRDIFAQTYDKLGSYSQGFAEKCAEAGVDPEQLVKKANPLLLELGRYAEMLPLWTKRMFNMLPKRKATWVLPPWELETGKRGISRLDQVITPARYAEERLRRRKDMGLVLAPLSRLGGGKSTSAILPQAEGLADKWNEYKMFKKFIPKTVLLSSVLRKTKNPDLVKMLNAKFGENQWILKERGGFATGAKNILVPENVKRMFMAPGGGIQFNYAGGGRKIRPVRELMVQERRDITAPKWQRAVDSWLDRQTDMAGQGGLFEGPRRWLANQWPEAFNRGTKEFRVHVHGGKIIPHGTINRGSVIGALGGELAPWTFGNARKAERFAAEVAASMKGRTRKGLYGLDVGIDAKGNPFLIEANPNTMRTGMSGLVTDAPYMDRILAHFEGRTPADVVGKRLAWGLGGAGALGAGGLGAASAMKD